MVIDFRWDKHSILLFVTMRVKLRQEERTKKKKEKKETYKNFPFLITINYVWL